MEKAFRIKLHYFIDVLTEDGARCLRTREVGAARCLGKSSQPASGVWSVG